MGGRLKGRDICILLTDSRWCTAEINTTLLSDYPPIKNFWNSEKLSVSFMLKRIPTRKFLKMTMGAVLSHQSCPILCNHMDCSPPGSSVHFGFSNQEYWSGLPCLPTGDPDPRTKPRSPTLQVDSFPTEPSAKPEMTIGV